MADKRKTNSEKKQKSQAATLKEVICRLGRYRIFLVFSILLATVSGSNSGDDSDWCVHTDHGIGTVADECV